MAVPFDACAMMPAMILHADDALIVICKPAGLLAVPGRGVDKADCAAVRVQALYPDVRVVHRLDMATSGLMLMARGAAVQRHLSRAFETRRVDKCYVAIVHGLIADDAGEITLPIGADWPNRPRQRVDAAGGKPALTRWRVLARDRAAQTTRLALQPLTGRTHQLRVHLAAIGHAIVGDALYAAPSQAVRLMLHARSLALEHPLDGQRVNFEAPLPF
jgi:tRNA pseudouridine32 synthase/23S rRNA pseudouridine746 synthase